MKGKGYWKDFDTQEYLEDLLSNLSYKVNDITPFAKAIPVGEHIGGVGNLYFVKVLCAGDFLVSTSDGGFLFSGCQSSYFLCSEVEVQGDSPAYAVGWKITVDNNIINISGDEEPPVISPDVDFRNFRYWLGYTVNSVEQHQVYYSALPDDYWVRSFEADGTLVDEWHSEEVPTGFALSNGSKRLEIHDADSVVLHSISLDFTRRRPYTGIARSNRLEITDAAGTISITIKQYNTSDTLMQTIGPVSVTNEEVIFFASSIGTAYYLVQLHSPDGTYVDFKEEFV